MQPECQPPRFKSTRYLEAFMVSCQSAYSMHASTCDVFGNFSSAGMKTFRVAKDSETSAPRTVANFAKDMDAVPIGPQRNRPKAYV